MRGALGRPPPPAEELELYNFPPIGPFNWTVTRTGLWKFVQWGAGGGHQSGWQAGGSGAYTEKTKRLVRGEVVVIAPGKANLGAAGTESKVTFADGTSVTAGGGQASIGVNLGGVAVGGDVNFNGSGTGDGAGQGSGAGTSTGGGSSAPGVLPFRGGGADGNYGHAPGGGSQAPSAGGSGLILVLFVGA